MTARWGFDLDMSAVRLMRREGDAWHEVARENIDGPDIEDRLMALAKRVENGDGVHLFLPRDQILYTDVKITSEDNARAEIEAAMDGRTPYALDELNIDWVLTEPGTARVAAIAEETLDEAVTFAEARRLGVAGLSSLADPADFPRLPTFRAGHVTLGPDLYRAPAPEPVAVPPKPAFTTTRTPPDKLPTDGPVLKIDDAEPVMRVKSNPLPPLDPGAPLENANTPPRVRTDIAAGTLSGVAASLKPDAPAIRVHAAPAAPWRTLMVFIIAAILTIGVAIVVWSILPMSPGRSQLPEPPASVTEPEQAPEQAAALPETTKSAPAPEQAAALPETPDLPQPEADTELAGLSAAPQPETAPDLPSALSGVPHGTALALLPPPSAAGVPTAAAEALEATPPELAALDTDAPIQSLDGSEDVAETTLDIYIASVERRDLAFDAIALPRPEGAEALRLPEIGAPPAPADDQPEIAAAVPPLRSTVTPLESTRRLEPTRRLLEPAESPEDEAAAQPATEEAEPELPRPTELAAALPSRAPRARPEAFTDDIERQQFGGRTRDELKRIAPKARPDSAQIVALANREAQAEPSVSDLAVETSLAPRGRPDDFDAIVATAVVQARAAQVTASLDFETPDTSAAIEAALADDAEPEPRPQDTPRLAIPSSASVSRQATVEDAIRLNKINLVGVYGVPSDRRALIRLPSGRYVKVKVGDRIDGGTVAQISDSELIYRKGSRTHSLTMPKG